MDLRVLRLSEFLRSSICISAAWREIEVTLEGWLGWLFVFFVSTFERGDVFRIAVSATMQVKITK
jgi:hypothetical protein